MPFASSFSLKFVRPFLNWFNCAKSFVCSDIFGCKCELFMLLLLHLLVAWLFDNNVIAVQLINRLRGRNVVTMCLLYYSIRFLYYRSGAVDRLMHPRWSRLPPLSREKCKRGRQAGRVLISTCLTLSCLVLYNSNEYVLRGIRRRGWGQCQLNNSIRVQRFNGRITSHQIITCQWFQPSTHSPTCTCLLNFRRKRKGFCTIIGVGRHPPTHPSSSAIP